MRITCLAQWHISYKRDLNRRCLIWESTALSTLLQAWQFQDMSSVVTSHWLGLESTRVAIFDLTWLDSIFHLNDLTWLESPVKWFWLDSDSTACWLESWQMTWVMTHTRTRFSTWIMWSCEPWLCPHLILGEKILNWYYLVTSVNIKMVHSTPLRVFMYCHWDDHAVDKIFLSLYKRGIHYTILTWGDLKEKLLDLTWTIMWLDLKKIAMTWLDLRLEYFWLDLTCDSSKGDLLQH